MNYEIESIRSDSTYLSNVKRIINPYMNNLLEIFYNYTYEDSDEKYVASILNNIINDLPILKLEFNDNSDDLIIRYNSYTKLIINGFFKTVKRDILIKNLLNQ